MEAVTTQGEPGSGTMDEAPDAYLSRNHGLPPMRAAVIVALVGLVITVTVSGAAWTLNRHNEHRLLEVQTRQAVAVLSEVILNLQGPLDTALQIETATGGSTGEFNKFATSNVGPGIPSYRPCSSGRTEPPGSLSRRGHPALDCLVVAAGAGAHRQGAEVVDIRSWAHPHEHSENRLCHRGSQGPHRRHLRRTGDSDEPDGPGGEWLCILRSEFRYLPRFHYEHIRSGHHGPAPTQLPITGDAVRESIPFGDSSVTLVTSPRGPLGGELGRTLPFVLLIGGLLLTLGATVVTYQLVRRRRSAEQDAQTIATLYQQLDGLYDEQRSISDSLQRALLPQRNPSVPNLEAASRYLAGTDGVEIGGDWFSLIDIDERHFAFAVGDVSGKGVDAAAIMARLRFTIRAYLTEGHVPDVVLEMCSRQLSVNPDGHMATVLIGVGDTDTGVVTMANAGHLNPLQVSDNTAAFLPTNVGLPLVAPGCYATTTVKLASGSALVAFTDGLVERRGENIDIGLKRLLHVASARVSTIEDLLNRLTAPVVTAGAEDDIAVLAFRWTQPASRMPGRPSAYSTNSMPPHR